MKSILLVKKLSGLVEMTSGLVSASFRLPEWQAVKLFSLHPDWPYGEISFGKVFLCLLHHQTKL